MRKAGKILALALTAATFIASAAAFAGCNRRDDDENNNDSPYYDAATVYAQAQQLGYSGTLEEFIEMISGRNGTNGKDGEKGDRGDDGVGVKSGKIDEHGHLILTLTDDSEIDCGAIQNVHTHTFGEWILIKENNCATAGLELRTCECGYTESKIIPATGEHAHLIWETTETMHTLYCDECKTEIKSGEHEFVDGVCECGVAEPVVITIPVEYTEISRNYGLGPDPLTGAYSFHVGIDFNAPVGTDVVAALGGTVESIVTDDNVNGNSIILTHGNGVMTVYLFANIKEGLKVGDKVKGGELIATVSEAAGNENMQAPHLHFEVIYNGEQVDPAEFLGLTE